MTKPKYVLTATREDGQSASKVDRALGVIGGVGVRDDAELAKRLENLPEGTTVHIRRAAI